MGDDRSPADLREQARRSVADGEAALRKRGVRMPADPPSADAALHYLRALWWMVLADERTTNVTLRGPLRIDVPDGGAPKVMPPPDPDDPIAVDAALSVLSAARLTDRETQALRTVAAAVPGLRWAPTPYQIAEAIEIACEASGITVRTMELDGQRSPDSLDRLARCLDTAGLIDWSGVGPGEAGGEALPLAPDPLTERAALRLAQLVTGDVLTQDDRDAIARVVGELDARWAGPGDDAPDPGPRAYSSVPVGPSPSLLRGRALRHEAEAVELRQQADGIDGGTGPSDEDPGAAERRRIVRASHDVRRAMAMNGATDGVIKGWSAFAGWIRQGCPVGPDRGGPVADDGNRQDGAGLIAAERRRQVDVEGWTAEHDAGHEYALAEAAACYVLPAEDRDIQVTGEPYWWPWPPEAWKPSPDDRVRELVKAGALIAAEIDRRQAGETGGDGQ